MGCFLCNHRGAQVCLAIALYLLCAPYLPLPVHQGLFTISLLIKDVLIWTLPLTVCFFIAHTIASFQQRAPLFVITIILFEACSNWSSIWYSFFSGHLASHYLPVTHIPSLDISFEPLWKLSLQRPTWWSANIGTCIGLLLGGFAAWRTHSNIASWIAIGKDWAQWTLTKVFSPLIPLFVTGFVARMYQTHILSHVIANYGVLLIWLCGFLFLYISLLFYIGNGLSLSRSFHSLQNLLPAGSLAFTSGCSLSTMPWTISGTSKNLKEPSLAQAIIPATTNIQQIGDCITNTFLCFLLYTHFFGHPPDVTTWLSFSIVFTLARFATAAVLGGAIFIMLPIYESYLSFNPEMVAIILAFNVILDPLVTSCNVMANGALCQIFENIWQKLTAKL